MPQLNLLTRSDDVVGIRIQWCWPDTPNNGPIVSLIELRRWNGDWYTLIAQAWEGIMVDFITTFMSDVAIAFAFGEPKGVLAAAVHTHRAARAHMKEHQAD